MQFLFGFTIAFLAIKGFIVAWCFNIPLCLAATLFVFPLFTIFPVVGLVSFF